jgi:hypothetical protein
MADGHGGPRTPNSPAPVSGPGALSKRTDGPQGGGAQPVRVPTGGQYGDATQLRQAQQGAPLAASQGGSAAAPPPGLLAGLNIPTGPNFDAATQQPDVPVTAGAASGPGPGPEALGLPNQEAQDMAALAAYLPVFESVFNQSSDLHAGRNLVRQIKGAS